MRSAPYIPAVHARYLADLLADTHGIEPDVLVAGTGVDLERAVEPGARLGFPELERIAARAEELTRDPLLGIALGLRMHAATHGYLGFAVLSASTLGDALHLAQRYIPTMTNALALRAHVSGDRVSLGLEERADLGDARRLVILTLLIGLSRIGASLTGSLPEGRVELNLPAPANWKAHPVASTLPLVFDMPSHRIVFRAAQLERKIVSADPAAAALARAHCEEALVRLGEPATVVARVEALLSSVATFPPREVLAKQLGMSTRTFERRLRAEATSYRAVVEGARLQRAELLLDRHDLTLSDVAEHLGYSDVANFSRAFRRWTGTTPGAFRRRDK